MKKIAISLLFGAVLGIVPMKAQTKYDFSKLKTENLGRGVVAVRQSQKEVFVTWRYLVQDARNVAFNVYRDGKKLNSTPIEKVTYFVDNNASSAAAKYTVKPVINGKETDGKSGTFAMQANAPVGYVNIPLQKPVGGKTPDGKTYGYTANDASIGDVDGDGEYEIFLKWEPTNAHDNSHNGYTGNVLIDCYRLSGEKLWRVDLGRNIRAGAHYTQFMVFDFDGDGKAEMAVRTSDGSKDGKGKIIGDAKADYRSPNGHVFTGKEYLTVFNGLTGAAMASVDFEPNRGDTKDWGDDHGNRSERMLAAVAYLDGIRPSIIMCRGYYAKTMLAAYNWDGKNLSKKWIFDSSVKGNEDYAGQGNHNLRVGDVDGDGCDEIIYGSCAIDHDGKGLYSTKMGHGDAMHLTQFIPGKPALQVWDCHENKKDGSTLTDAATGKVLFQLPSNIDVGRCMAADIMPSNNGVEMWSIDSKGIYNYKGKKVADLKFSRQNPFPVNSAVWWDGDLSRELLDRNVVYKYNEKTNRCDTLQVFDGTISNNGTKATPCLQGDLYGDWREEVLLRTKDDKNLRLYVSTLPAEYRFHTFLTDPVYRISIATQNVAYNQPTQPGFYFGTDLSGDFRGAMLPLKDDRKVKTEEDVNKVIDLTLDSLNKANTVRPVAGSSRKGHNPVLFLVGNSTMRTGTLGNGNNGQWGWGYYAHEYFDENYITVENHALGGTSPRTFYRHLWPDVIKGVQKGDYVILELGHNDNGPIDSGRARSSIKGIGNDSVVVTIKETGAVETVYSFGGYLRRFINEIRAKGATPILFTLTPRNSWDNDSTITRKLTNFDPWIKAISEEMNVALVDLEDITAKKFEKFGPKKVNYHFYLDKIHSSEFGARINAESAAEGIAACSATDLRDYLKPLNKPTVKVKREKGKPVVFLTGDSTVKNEDKKDDGMWGWGSQASLVFNTEKCTPVNCAKAGRSCRTYLDEGRWDEVYNSIQPGDYVLIQFGHNDMGPINTGKARADIAGTADSSHVYKMEKTQRYKVVYTFGWYLRKFIEDVREKGGTPILLSLTPRNIWKDGKIERRNDSYGKWYREVVEQTGVAFVDVHNISADFLDKLGEEKAKEYYNHDHTHTSKLGAQNNARSFAKGAKKNKQLKALKKLLK